MKYFCMWCRTICWKVAGGQVLIGYQRGLMRRNVSTVMYRCDSRVCCAGPKVPAAFLRRNIWRTDSG